VFPYDVTAAKLHHDIPDLVKDTWLWDVAEVPRAPLFGAAATKTIRCDGGLAVVNPEYEMRPLRDMSPPRGVPVQRFALWYSRIREIANHVADQTTRRDPWLIRCTAKGAVVSWRCKSRCSLYRCPFLRGKDPPAQLPSSAP